MRVLLLLTATSLNFLLFFSPFVEGTDPTKSGFDVSQVVSLLSNRDVIWEGQYVGVVPYLSPNAEFVLANFDDGILARLVSFLGDDEKYVVAHVLLTKRLVKQYPIQGTHWNHLQIDLDSVGDGVAGSKQKARIQDYWKRHLVTRK